MRADSPPLATMSPTTVSWRARHASPRFVAQVRDGLLRRHRELPSAFLTDPEITEVRQALEQVDDARFSAVEAPLIQKWAMEGVRSRPIERVVEVMPSGASTAHTLIQPFADQQGAKVYLAVAESLTLAAEAAARVRDGFPDVVALSTAADPTLTLPVRRAPCTTFALLAGALGRHAPVAAVRVLRAIRASMTPEDHLIIGLDLRSAPDAVAQTSVHTRLRDRLHRHALEVANRDLGTNFVAESFSYACRVDEEAQRVDEGVACQGAAQVRSAILGAFTLRPGELLRTQVRCRYSEHMLDAMLRGVGLRLDSWQTSACGSHALAHIVVRLTDDDLA